MVPERVQRVIARGARFFSTPRALAPAGRLRSLHSTCTPHEAAERASARPTTKACRIATIAATERRAGDESLRDRRRDRRLARDHGERVDGEHRSPYREERHREADAPSLARRRTGWGSQQRRGTVGPTGSRKTQSPASHHA